MQDPIQPPRQPKQGEDFTEVPHPSELVPADQNPPEGYEPQPNLEPGQSPYLQEREPDLITEAEAEEPDASEDDGVADDNDDAVEFDPPDERPKHP